MNKKLRFKRKFKSFYRVRWKNIFSGGQQFLYLAIRLGDELDHQAFAYTGKELSKLLQRYII